MKVISLVKRFHPTVAIVFALLAIINLRLFWLPGLEFNSKIWDDENAWLDQYQNSSILDFILQRDGAGYYIFLPRLLFVIAQLLPLFGPVEPLRILIVLIQLICFAVAAFCVLSKDSKKYFWLAVFVSLSLTYIEDLNYLHNVGYLYIFPIYFVAFNRINRGRDVPLFSVVLCALLICKPFTAVLTILLIVFYHWKKSINLYLYLLFLYSLTYLALYVILPHGYQTPFNTNVGHLFYIIVDLPWILFTALFPAFYIGFFGLINLFHSADLRLIFGIMTNVLQLVILFMHRKLLWNSLIGLSTKSKSFLLILAGNYVLVFSSYDSFWVKNFPLYTFQSPQFIWARWSAVIPLTALIFIASLNQVSLRVRLLVLGLISSQWLLLMFLGKQFLLRYW